MNNLDTFDYYNDLFDLYKTLLTDKQQLIATKYFVYNLSFGEIAQDLNISRAGVNDSIKKIKEKLNTYESKLKLNEKLLNISKEINELVKDEKLKEQLIEVIYNGI